MKNPCKTCPDGKTIPKGDIRTVSICKNYPNECDKKKAYNEYKASRRKYQKGRTRIKELADLKGLDFVWYIDRPISVEFLKNMKFTAVQSMIETGLYKVKDNKEG